MWRKTTPTTTGGGNVVDDSVERHGSVYIYEKFLL